MKKKRKSIKELLKVFYYSKPFLIMRITVFLLLFSVIQVMGENSYSQNTRLSLNLKDVSIENVLDEIENQSEFYFLFNQKLVNVDRKVDINAKNKQIKDILADLFASENVNCMVLDRQILLSPEYMTETVIVTRDRQPQEIVVTGKVTSEDGNSLPGVNILIKGTITGTISNMDGDFSIEVDDPEAAVLVFSFIGYRAQEVAISGRSVINITLAEEVFGLEEVVAIGYGTQRKRQLTGSVSAVKTDKLEDIPVTQVMQKLQGQLAGVQINQTSGTPGSGMNIRIRGAASISAGNEPLYVVDGFPIVNGINSINSNEIQEISILKGVAAASLYGSRAANGVVLVTTKQAKKGDQLNLKVNATFGVGVIPENTKPEVMNAKEFLTSNKYFWEDKIRYQGANPDDMPEIYKNPDAWTGVDTYWFDELLRKSRYQDYNISLSHGSDKVQTSNVMSFHDEKGIVLNSGYKRFSLRSNNTFNVSDNIRAGINIAPTLYTSSNVDTDGNYRIIMSSFITPPIFDPNKKNPDGSLVGSYPEAQSPVFPYFNPKQVLLESTDEASSVRLLSNAFVEIDFLKDFQIRSMASAESGASLSREYIPSYVANRIWQMPPRKATGSSRTNSNLNWVWENTLKYNKTIGNKHNIDFLLGYSAQKYKQDYVYGQGNTFADDEIRYISAAINKTASAGAEEWSLASIFSRLNYNYNGKYLLSASFRRDGCSRFGQNNLWGSFPSVSAGWIVSEEEFAKDLPVLSYLKLRAEYGKAGNYNVGNYSHFGSISGANYVIDGSIVPGRQQTSISNAALTWETTEGLGVGLDVGFLKDRLSFVFDYYNKTTDGLLYRIDIPIATGYTSINSNIGEFNFWGYEFSAITKNLVGSFKWNTNFNISFDRNKVIKLGTENSPIGGGSTQAVHAANRTEVGQPIGQFWGAVSDGIYETQAELDSEPKADWNELGSAKYKDINGDGIVTDTDDDKTFLGNPQPDFTFGMANSLSYKNFDLSIQITGSYGNKLQYGVREWTESLTGFFNMEKYLLDRWRSPENPGSGIVPGTAMGNTHMFSILSDRQICDASYLAIKNITLGYNLPKFTKHIKNARVYGSIQQALVITKYPGTNPEASNLNGLFGGVDNGNYPIPRTIAFGLNFTF